MNTFNPNPPSFGVRSLARPPVAARAGGSTLRRRAAVHIERHLLLAVNLGILSVVAGMSLLVWMLPFGEPLNVLLAAAAVVGLASAVSAWWKQGESAAASEAP